MTALRTPHCVRQESPHAGLGVVSPGNHQGSRTSEQNGAGREMQSWTELPSHAAFPLNMVIGPLVSVLLLGSGSQSRLTSTVLNALIMLKTRHLLLSGATSPSASIPLYCFWSLSFFLRLRSAQKVLFLRPPRSSHICHTRRLDRPCSVGILKIYLKLPWQLTLCINSIVLLLEPRERSLHGYNIPKHYC